MPIDVNRIDLSGLASAAGNNTRDLGLKSYGVDIGAPALGEAEGYWKAQDLQEKYSQQQNLAQIAQAQQQGILTKTQADNLTKAAIAEYSQRQQNSRQDSINQIQQQNAITNRINAGSNLANVQSQIGNRTAQLGINQQTADQTGAYQQGQLGIGQQNVDVNKFKAQQDAMKNKFDQAMKLSDVQQNKMKQVGSAISTILSQPGLAPDKQQQLIGQTIQTAKDSGTSDEILDHYKGKSLQEMSMVAMASTLLSNNVDRAKSQAASQGLQFTQDSNGNMVTKPIPAPIDPNSPEAIANKSIGAVNTSVAKSVENAAQTTDKLVQDTQTGMDLLQKIPSSYIGPIAGRIGLGIENTDVQKLDKILSGIPLIQKSATLGQSAGQRLFQSELELMRKSSGTLNLNPQALKWILQTQNTEAKISRYSGWQKEFNGFTSATPELKEQWVKSHPMPDEPQVEVVDPTGQHGTVPYTQLEAYLAANKGAERW